MILTQTKTVNLTNIEQVQISGREAIESGFFEANMANCTGCSESDPVYVYSFGGIVGGAIWGNEASLSVLAEFAGCADDMAADIWRDVRFEIEEYLHEQQHSSMGY